MKTGFSRHIFEKAQTASFTKIRPAGDELFHTDRTDGRTDITKLGVAFRNFANARRKRDSKCEKCEDINENNLCDDNGPGDSDNAACRQRFSLWAIWTRWRMLVMDPLGLQ